MGIRLHHCYSHGQWSLLLITKAGHRPQTIRRMASKQRHCPQTSQRGRWLSWLVNNMSDGFYYLQLANADGNSIARNQPAIARNNPSPFKK